MQSYVDDKFMKRQRFLQQTFGNKLKLINVSRITARLVCSITNDGLVMFKAFNSSYLSSQCPEYLHVRTYLHERLLLIIWNYMCDSRFVKHVKCKL